MLGNSGADLSSDISVFNIDTWSERVADLVYIGVEFFFFFFIFFLA